MNIDFNAAFEGGMTKQDIEEMLARQLEAAENEYNEKKAAKAKEDKASTKEQLKAEGRAYAINALVCYSEAFDLLNDGEAWDDEDIARLEQALIKLEDMIPVYIKLAKMQGEMDKLFGDGDLGLGGPFFGSL